MDDDRGRRPQPAGATSRSSSLERSPAPTDDDPPRRTPPRPWLWSGPKAPTRGSQAVAVAVLPVCLLATAMLWWPDHGDQALFIVGGQRLNEGGVYYRDVWDIKQPGIYWFYQAGDLIDKALAEPLGSGYSGLGARLLEALLIVISAALVAIVTSSWALRRSVRLAAPTVVLGPYLIWSFVGGVGQIEGLLNVVLLAVLACSWPRGESSQRVPGPVRTTVRSVGSWGAAGVGGAVIVLMKTIYAPLGVAVLVGALIASRRSTSRAGLLARASACALGAGAPVGAALLYFQQHAVLGLALKTTFVLPRDIQANVVTGFAAAAELRRAVDNMFAVVGLLAALAVLGSLRAADGSLSRTLALTLVAVAGIGLALAPAQLYTPYRLLMLATPLGLLAVSGLELLMKQLHTLGRAAVPARTAAVILAAALTAPMLRGPVALTLRPGDTPNPWSLAITARVARSSQARPTSPEQGAQVAADQVSPGEALYVIGDPTVMLLLGARQGIEINGWALPMQPVVLHDEVARQLRRSHPRLVYVDLGSRAWVEQEIADTSPIGRVLIEDYREISRTAAGTWYETGLPGVAVPTPEGNLLFR